MRKAIRTLSVVFLAGVSSFVLAGSPAAQRECGENYDEGHMKCEGMCPNEMACTYVPVGFACECALPDHSLRRPSPNNKKKK